MGASKDLIDHDNFEDEGNSAYVTCPEELSKFNLLMTRDDGTYDPLGEGVNRQEGVQYPVCIGEHENVPGKLWRTV